MKSISELVKDPGFAVSLAFAFMIAGWNLAYGSWIIGVIFLVLIMGSIFLNAWKCANAFKRER